MNIIDELKEKNNIVIFGAGIMGKYIYNTISNDIKISAFCDNMVDVNINRTFCGLPVYRLNELQSKYDDITFIISGRGIEDIKKQLDSFGYKSYPAYLFFNPSDVPASEFTFIERQKMEWTWYVHKFFCEKELLNLCTVDLVITEKCSLRCRECSNLMQYYTSPSNFSIEDISRTTNRLMQVVNEIYEVRVIGGEPLMHPQFSDVIKVLGKYSGIKRICIYTNATILPSKEALLAMAELGGKVWFSVSDYGNLSRRLEQLESVLAEYDIDYVVKEIEFWTSCSSLEKRNRSLEELSHIYHQCCVKDLITYINGILSPCPFIGNALNLKAIPSVPSDYVDIMQETEIGNLRKQVKDILVNRDYFLSCDYCQGRPDFLYIKDGDKIPPHEQTKQPLPYTKFD